MLRKLFSFLSVSNESKNTNDGFSSGITYSLLSTNKNQLQVSDPKSLASYIGGMISANPPLGNSQILSDLVEVGMNENLAQKAISLTIEAFGHSYLSEKSSNPPEKAILIGLEKKENLEIILMDEPVYVAAFEIAQRESTGNPGAFWSIVARSASAGMIDMAKRGQIQLSSISVGPPIMTFSNLTDIKAEGK